MAEQAEKGVGKCANDHARSYGYPSRPEEPYGFRHRCGQSMVWHCSNCETPLPDDSDELVEARFCRQCGTAYYGDSPE